MYRYVLMALLMAGSLRAEWSQDPCLDQCFRQPCLADCFQEAYLTVGEGVVFPGKNSSSTSRSSSVLYSPTAVPGGTSLFDLPSVKWKNKYITGYELNAAVGFAVCPCWRVEGEFLYQNLKHEISGEYNWRETNASTTALYAQNFGNPIQHASNRTNIYCLLTNLFYDYQNLWCKPWTFSIGGGVGVAWLNSRSTTRNNILSINTTTPPLNESSPTIEKSPSLYGTAFAWQMKLGLKYDFCECFGFAVNYRLFGTTKFHSGTSSITSNPNTSAAAVFKMPRQEISGFLNNSLNFSFDYRF